MMTELAVTESGTQLRNYTDDDVQLGLRVLILQGGDTSKAVQSLGEEGIKVDAHALRYWRDTAFPELYGTLRRELTDEAGDEMAARAMKRAQEADEASAKYIAEAMAKVDEVKADNLAKSAEALAKTMGHNVDKAQLLRNKPTSIQQTQDIGEIFNILRDAGVLVRDPRDAIEGRAKEKAS